MRTVKHLRNGIIVFAFIAGVDGVLAQTPLSPPPGSTPSGTPVAGPSVPPPPQAPLVVRVEQVAPIQLEQAGASSWWARLAPIMAPLVSGFIALGGVWLGLRVGQSNTQKTIDAALRTSEAAINQKASEAELKEIQDKLDKPLVERREGLRIVPIDRRAKLGRQDECWR